jgi:hypothetical protein
LSGFEAAYSPYEKFTSAWPSAGPLGDAFTPMHAWGIPALNTMLLLTSGATLTWAHWGLIKGKQSQLTLGLFLFVVNAMMFWWVGDILSGFRVEGFFSALFGSVVYSLASWSLSSLTEKPRAERG